jgi:hypothetical protein
VVCTGRLEHLSGVSRIIYSRKICIVTELFRVDHTVLRMKPVCRSSFGTAGRSDRKPVQAAINCMLSAELWQTASDCHATNKSNFASSTPELSQQTRIDYLIFKTTASALHRVDMADERGSSSHELQKVKKKRLQGACDACRKRKSMRSSLPLRSIIDWSTAVKCTPLLMFTNSTLILATCRRQCT